MSATLDKIGASARRPTDIDAAEWKVRVELALLYRLAALYGWDDFLFTHISARVPGPQPLFLLNPLGLGFDEITASSLVKIDLDGNIVAGDHPINGAGFIIHSAIHAARADAHFIAHFHTDDGVALASQSEGLLPINQRALSVIPRLAYHDFEGFAEQLSERERLARDLGPHSSLILRNHGTLALASTAAEVWLRIYSLEKAATAQIRALSAGRDGVHELSTALQAAVADQVRRRPVAIDLDLVWGAMQRKVDRLSPGYDQ